MPLTGLQERFNTDGVAVRCRACVESDVQQGSAGTLVSVLSDRLVIAMLISKQWPDLA